jgi:hypothetical protein
MQRRARASILACPAGLSPAAMRLTLALLTRHSSPAARCLLMQGVLATESFGRRFKVGTTHFLPALVACQGFLVTEPCVDRGKIGR